MKGGDWMKDQGYFLKTSDFKKHLSDNTQLVFFLHNIYMERLFVQTVPYSYILYEPFFIK
jgi:hypothetical protein